MTAFSKDEILEIASSLEDYHRVFYTFFEMANVLYSDSIKTAAIHFHPDTKPDLLINKEFWEKQNHRERLFIVCHECLHVLLRHGTRNGMNVKGATHKLVNIAQDICINEIIVSMFGYNRDDLRDWKKYCWIDTCFDEPSKVLRNETFLYYLDLLIQQQKQDLPDLVDEHSDEGKPDDDSDEQMDVDAADAIEEKVNDLAGQLAEDLSRDQIDKIAEGGGEGTPIAVVREGMMTLGTMGAKKRKVHFVKLIRHLKRTRMKEGVKETDSFARQDRRFEDVIRRSDVTLPGKNESPKKMKDRLLTVLFMDISGSCVEYVPTFNRVYEAFAKEEKLFEIRAFTFDTHVREVKYGDRIIGGGGTRFNILEEKVQKLKEEYGKYPDCIVVISDGEGNHLYPEIPSRWIWLLTDRPSYTYIHSKSKKYLIKDVSV